MFPPEVFCDTLLAKLVGISKGSHKSRRDLRQIMHGANEPEREAVMRHAEAIGLASLLAEVLAEPDEIAP